jgi:hypothetical protein
MQTFLPYSSFVKTARCLDWRRLGKQRAEAFQVIDISLKVLKRDNPEDEKYKDVILDGPRIWWENHPARLMWQDHLYTLCEYSIIICDEWKRRGNVDIMKERFISLRDKYFEDNGRPDWINNSFCIAHRSNLIRKGRAKLLKKGIADDYLKYKSLWPDISENLPYIWPVTIKEIRRREKCISCQY